MSKGKSKQYEKLLKATVVRGNSTPEETTQLMTPILTLIEKMRPKKLFRYRACTGYTFDALLSDKTFFNPPISFNDPYDCLSYVDTAKVKSLLTEIDPNNIVKQVNEIFNSTHFIEENFSPNILPAVQFVYNGIKKFSDAERISAIEKLSPGVVDYERMKEWFSNAIEANRQVNLKHSRQETFIACFSEKIDSLLMWAHYADSHKGFAVEYDTSEIVALSNKCAICKDKEKCASIHFLDLFPVLYSKERYDATEYDIETLKSRLQESFGVGSPFCTPDKLFSIKSNTTKGIDWAYEKEWRLIYSCTSNHPEEKSVTLKPKAVYLGSQISAGNERIIRKLIDGKGLTVYKMFVNVENKKYSLNYKKV